MAKLIIEIEEGEKFDTCRVLIDGEEARSFLGFELSANEAVVGMAVEFAAVIPETSPESLALREKDLSLLHRLRCVRIWEVSRTDITHCKKL